MHINYWDATLDLFRFLLYGFSPWKYGKPRALSTGPHWLERTILQALSPMQMLGFILASRIKCVLSLWGQSRSEDLVFCALPVCLRLLRCYRGLLFWFNPLWSLLSLGLRYSPDSRAGPAPPKLWPPPHCVSAASAALNSGQDPSA